MSSALPARLARFSQHLPHTLLRDRPPLQRKLAAARRRLRGGQPIDRMVAELEGELAECHARWQQRRDALPVPTFPEQLPVVGRKGEIAELIRNHQVVVLCGETGSGKTTQLPKICLELGRGVAGMIGMTQPRRIAARSIAEYLAEDLKGELGGPVGYKVRFSDQVGDGTFIKVMTDGILLAETQGDRDLRQYDTLIIDEAHERGLNIDFLLGYIKQLLPRRPDLKLIIASATIDTDKFSRHFGNAPIIEVSGRTYPVELRYRPLRGEEEREELDLESGVVAAVDELCRLGPGDVLVFLPGEREIRDCAEALRKHHPPQTRILPLYARLSAAEQHRVFEAGGPRRLILSTNVAETSLTVPGIRYVVDSGLARISRFSGRNQVQRLPVERIAQSSADQRKGRCGRLSDGVCVRLFSADDFNNRPRYTDPEVLRTSLAAVILQMKALRLGEVAAFPFIDPPHPKAIREGERLLRELGALNEDNALTDIGWQLAKLPIDPRLGRMIIAAREKGCLTEVLVIAAALSVQDPRERPQEKRQVAEDAHRANQDPQSDFTTFLSLWERAESHRVHAKTKAAYRRFLQENFLSWNRMKEWREIHQQLSRLVKEMGMRPNQVPADYATTHQALLAGLLGGIGQLQERKEYQGAHQIRFHLHPGSGLFKGTPKWLVSAELVETTRLYARLCARIDPVWIEPIAGDLCRKSHSDPHWEKNRGQVVCNEQVTLYGLIIVPRRPVPFGPIDPVEARRLFIQGALVEGEMRSNAPFFQHNQRLLGELHELERKSRRRGVVVDPQVLFDFYDQRLADDIYDVRRLERWRKQAERDNPRLLHLDREALLAESGPLAIEEQYPGHLEVAGHELALEYHFDPGHKADGISVHIPLALLNQLPPEPFEWLVPGLLEEKITALLKSLPKTLRRPLVPIPHTAQELLKALLQGDDIHQQPLLPTLEKTLQRLKGVEVPGEAWRPEAIPDHLRINFLVVADDGERILARGRDLAVIRQEQGQAAQTTFRQLPKERLERSGIRAWDFGPLPERVSFPVNGREVPGFPALVAEGDGVALRVLDAPQAALAAQRAGLRQLFLLQLGQSARQLVRQLPLPREACLAYHGTGNCDELKQGLVARAAERAFMPAGWEAIRNAAAFAKALEVGRPKLWPAGEALAKLVGQIMAEHQALAKALKAAPGQGGIKAELAEQMEALVHPGFLLSTPDPWLNHLPRYLKGARLRLERSRNDPGRDAQRSAELAPFLKDWRTQREKNRTKGRQDPELETFRWMLEEFRISLFAQDLKTAIPVSPKRLKAQWSLVTRS